jgi:hypothetical protein
MTTYDGGCECGAVRYRMTDDPIFVNCCHCRQCQKITGSAFAINGMIEADRLEVTQGEDKLAPGSGQGRCSSCGTFLWGSHRMFGDNIRFVRLGTLDEAERFKPDAHFFVRSKHPWVTLPDDVPAFETLPGPDDPPLMSAAAAARLDAAGG